MLSRGGGAGLDCCAAMHHRKLRVYSAFTAELRQRGIRYQPLVWSCYGRALADVVAVLQSLAGAAARRRGLPAWRTVLQRACAAISVQLQRRLVAQVRRCLPGEAVLLDEHGAAEPRQSRVLAEEELQAVASVAAGPVAAAAAAVVGARGAAAPAPVGAG